MRRDVSASMSLDAPAPTAFQLAMAPARGVPVAGEELSVRSDGEPVPTRELDDLHGTRLHLFETGPGRVQIEYRATVLGRARPPAVDPLDQVVYLRPSRYVQSDVLQPFARETFPDRTGEELVREVEAWVNARLRYDGAATSPTGGAVETLESGAGVCRDFAHLVAGLLRALDVPARLVSVYAPELQPPDFHAVVEAFAGGRWVVADATRLAPRSGLVRVATGRDAADIAFLTNTLTDITLRELRVAASADRPLADDRSELPQLG